MECAHITVRGFNAHYNKWVTFTNLELEVEGLYRIIQNENILESSLFWPVFANITVGNRFIEIIAGEAFCHHYAYFKGR